MKQLELFDEPEYIAREDDYSGPHGDVREDFRVLVAGVPAVRAWWCCRRCRTEFFRRGPCEKHMLECPEHWHELNDDDQALVIRAAHALFEASKNIPNRMKPDSLPQRIKNTGAEIALARILQSCATLKPAHRHLLAQWDPRRNIGTYGAVPDLPIGRGIDVRQSDTCDLIFRPEDREHGDRCWAKMVGEFPRYGFAGWLIPDDIPDHKRFRETYGKTNVAPCTGFPPRVRNFRLEDLIAAL